MSAPSGVRCDLCDATFFAAPAACPRCGDARIRGVSLSPAGVVVSRTSVDGVDIGEVLLDDGVLVLTVLEGGDRAGIGARVRHLPDDTMRFEFDA